MRPPGQTGLKMLKCFFFIKFKALLSSQHRNLAIIMGFLIIIQVYNDSQRFF